VSTLDRRRVPREMTTPAVPASEEPRQKSTTDRRLVIAIVVLCLVGIADAGYLTYVHYAGIKVACLAHGGCETVQASRWAKLDGVPVSLLGLIGYIAILGTLLLRTELGRALGFGIALIGFGFSMYLTYREIFTIKAICQWCVSSAVIMTLLVILTAIRALRVEPGAPAVSAKKPAPRAERRRMERKHAARR
jgi:uncharacterized membrane protein